MTADEVVIVDQVLRGFVETDGFDPQPTRRHIFTIHLRIQTSNARGSWLR